MEKQLISGLKRKDFQAIVQGKQTDLFTLVNENGMEVSITNYGGALVENSGKVIFKVNNSNFTNNYAKNNAGALYGRMTVVGSNFVNNSATTDDFGNCVWLGFWYS